jgi:hypothetical protein
MKTLFSIMIIPLLVSCQTGMAAKGGINVVTVESSHSYRIYFNLRDVSLSEPITLEAAKQLAEAEFAKRGYCPKGIIIKDSWIGRLERSNDRVIRVDCVQ